MLKIIHGADFHLDSPFSGLTPEQAARRREEQRELLDRLARLARDKGADLVLLAGDLLDSQRCYRETAQALARALGDIPCPVFIAPGNHDYYSPRSVYATLDWPDNVHIFRDPSIQRVDLPRLNCAVYGRAFTAPHQEESPLSGFRAEGAEGTVRLMCLHGDTAPQSGLPGPGPHPPVQRPEPGGEHLLGLPRLSRGERLRRAGGEGGPLCGGGAGERHRPVRPPVPPQI